jgi:hypothetical protein
METTRSCVGTVLFYVERKKGLARGWLFRGGPFFAFGFLLAAETTKPQKRQTATKKRDCCWFWSGDRYVNKTLTLIR